MANSSTSPNFTYKWDDGSTTSQKQITHSGQHCYTVTHVTTGTCKKGCVLVQPIQHVSVSTKTLSICSDGTGKISTIVTGGTLPYYHLWSNGATTRDLTGLSTGTYTVTVTDKNNCQASQSTTIRFTTGELIIWDSTIPITSCDSHFLSPTVSTSNTNDSYDFYPLKFNWSSGQTTSYITINHSGNYCLTVTGANLCSKVKCFDIKLEPEISLTTTKNTNCPSPPGNGTINVTASGGAPPYTYSYNPGPQNVSTAVLTGLTAGNYYVTVTDKNGCSSYKSTIIEGNNKIDFIAKIKNQCSSILGGRNTIF